MPSLTQRLFPIFVKANRFAYEKTGGRIGGSLRGAPVLLLTTTGRRSGKRRTTPLLYLADGDRIVVVASYGGAPNDPAWYLNLVANPNVEVQIGREKRSLRARVASDEERKVLWPKVVGLYADYQAYQDRTARTIPVVILERPPVG